MRRTLITLVFATLAAAGQASPARAPSWRAHAPLPLARSEVAAAALGREVVVAGGFLADGSSSARVGAYSPSTGRWRRLPDLPQAVNHATAAVAAGRLYVLGGYAEGGPQTAAWTLESGRWRTVLPMPEPRAAAGAAAMGRRIYVAGGVTEASGGRTLARTTLVYSLDTGRWTKAAGPAPREHLGMTASRGSVYAIAGRTAGLDTNVATVERYDPGTRRWQRVQPVPEARGGTAAAAWRGTIVSAGGEAPGGTIRKVYALDTRTGRWRRLPDLRTPRHGLGVVALAGRIYAVAGGRTPGLSVSGTNESLTVR
ncbi:MAG: Kelch repeat-containing protein [Gaiellaceae bacterium]